MAQVEFILSHSEARAVLFAGEMQSTVLSDLKNRLPALQGLLALDDRSGPWHDRFLDLSRPERREPEALESVRALAQSLSDESVASIVYTSGTTGQPKGVMLTHANICFNLRQCITASRVSQCRPRAVGSASSPRFRENSLLRLFRARHCHRLRRSA